MRITMMATQRGSEDGWDVKLYRKGKTDALGDMLARYFIRRRFAVQEGCEPVEPFESPFAFRFPDPEPRVPTKPATYVAKGEPL